MRINNNIMALNAHRQLGVNQANSSKSMERLSSGMRINRAGDDAAGLAISEKMRGQIRGLKQASRNSQDAISLIQTAEGALNETHAILQRMRELATQSASDTNTEVDRGEIQKEINELAAEITRIADTTEFNTQNLLGGEFSGIFHIGANEGQNITLSINAMDANALKVSGSGEGEATFELTIELHNTGIAVTGLGIVEGENELSVVKLDNISVGSDVANYGLANADGDIVAISQDGKTYKFLDDAYAVNKLATQGSVAAGTTDLKFDETVKGGTVTFDATEAGELSNIVASSASIEVEGLATGTYTVATIADGEAEAYFDGVNWHDNSAADHISAVLLDSEGKAVAVTFDDSDWYAVEDLNLTGDAGIDGSALGTNVIGDAEAIMTVATTLTNGHTLEIKADGGIDVSTQEAADRAITIINEAIETVSAERSKLGAYQNRLEHTIANLGTSAENLQAAESRIRDLDMAEEIMAFTKNNILQQAATAMLAQANMAPQSVLQLLG